MKIPYEIFMSTMLSECYARRHMIFALFAVISLTMLTAGFIWPKKYMAFSIVHVDESNILQSLMQGTAEATMPTDHAANAREIIYGEKIMDSVLYDIDLANRTDSDVVIEKAKQKMKDRVKVSAVGANLLRIEYQDSDPKRTYDAVNRITELYIQEGKKAKRDESQSAYDFIDKQVKEYLVKLTAAEEELRQFHSKNPSARPGTQTIVSERISDIQNQIEQAKMELSEAEIKRRSLRKQLNGEAAISLAQSSESQYITKIAALEDELQRLRLDYKDTHPDIVRVKHQIVDLKEAMEKDAVLREQEMKRAKQTGTKYVDKTIVSNPLYQELRSNAAKTDTQIATLKARIEEMNKMLENVYERAKNISGGEATLAKLTRDYTVNQEIYQDLLRRRENARVSKNLDQDQKGLTLSVQEPAKVPIIASGMRFIHFALAGLVLGIAIPLALVFVIVKYDPRVRFSEIINNNLNVPVIADIHKISTDSELVHERHELIKLGYGVLAIFAIYAVVGIIKMTGMFS